MKKYFIGIFAIIMFAFLATATFAGNLTTSSDIYGNTMYGNRPPKRAYGMVPPPMYGNYGNMIYGNKPPKRGYGIVPPPMYGNRPPKGTYGIVPPPKNGSYGNVQYRILNKTYTKND